jgi:hypothetical protein
MTRTVGQCVWAVPTLSLPEPDWIEFTAAEWSCFADGPAHLLHDPRVCRTCSRWAERKAQSASPPETRPVASFTPRDPRRL